MIVDQSCDLRVLMSKEGASQCTVCVQAKIRPLLRPKKWAEGGEEAGRTFLMEQQASNDFGLISRLTCKGVGVHGLFPSTFCGSAPVKLLVKPLFALGARNNCRPYIPLVTSAGLSLLHFSTSYNFGSADELNGSLCRGCGLAIQVGSIGGSIMVSRKDRTVVSVLERSYLPL